MYFVWPVVEVSISLEETVEILTTQIMAVQEVVGVAIAITTITEAEVVAHIEDLEETIEGLGQIILHHRVVTAA